MCVCVCVSSFFMFHAGVWLTFSGISDVHFIFSMMNTIAPLGYGTRSGRPRVVGMEIVIDSLTGIDGKEKFTCYTFN